MPAPFDAAMAGEDGLLSVVAALMEVMEEDTSGKQTSGDQAASETTKPVQDLSKEAESSASTVTPDDDNATADAEAEGDSELMAGLNNMLGGYSSDPEEDAEMESEQPPVVQVETAPLLVEVDPAPMVDVEPTPIPVQVDEAAAKTPDLGPGCFVRVEGLRKAVDLNGRTGTVRRPDPADANRWQVDLKASGSMPRVVKSVNKLNLVALPPGEVGDDLTEESEAHLAVGSQVSIMGLQGAPQLNGRHGVVRGADPARAGRWQIELSDPQGNNPEVKSIKAENLAPVVSGGLPEAKSMPEVKSKPEEEEDYSGPLQPGCVVIVSGLQSNTALNDRSGIVKRRDPVRQGRWEVEFLGKDGHIEKKVSIREENLVLFKEEEKGEEDNIADDGYGILGAPDTDEEDKDEKEEEEEGDGLEEGAKVCIRGLCSAAAKHLNDQVGTLSAFDVAAGRWKVRLEDGGLKAIKPENLVLASTLEKEEEKEEIEEKEEEEEGNEDMEAWDANEIAAAAVQAELSGGNPRRAERLRKLLSERRAQDVRLSARGLEEGPLLEEVIELQEQVVGRIIGRGGENIMRLTELSGARLTITRPRDAPGGERGPRRCTILGLASEVEKAKALLQEAVNEALEALRSGGKKGKGKGKGKGKFGDLTGEGAGGRAGFVCGVCKWYAAGFCRNPTGANMTCRNGLHSGEAAKRAEADWVHEAPDAGTVEGNLNGRPLLLLLDLEGGGNKDGRDGEDEIIEMPVLAMCPSTGKELGRFHRFVRPGYWVREEASMRRRFLPACFNAEANSVPFPEAVTEMGSWLCKLLQVQSVDAINREQFLFVTCGNWDVKTCIPRQCSKTPGAINLALQKLLFSRWSNLKEVFREHYRLPEEVAPTGMRGMLRRLGIPLSGQHHLGMDDVSNLSKILYRIINEGCCIGPTGHATSMGFGDFSSKGFKGKGFGKGKGKFRPFSDNWGAPAGKGPGAWGTPPAGAWCKGGKIPVIPPPPPKQPNPPPKPQPAGVQSKAEAKEEAKAEAKEEAKEEADEGPKAKAELGSFLKGAPLPGQHWTADDSEDSEAETGPSKASKRPRPADTGLLAGVFSKSDAGEDQKAKVPKISALLAGLPAPKGGPMEEDEGAEG